MYDSQQELDKVFLSYNKILKRLNAQNIKKKNGQEITYTDLKKAVYIMEKKHPNCRWRSTKIRNRKYLVLFEGYLWIKNVYFQTEKSQIEADIDFFEQRIKQYEELLKVDSKLLWDENIRVKDLGKYFHRQGKTIHNAILKMVEQNNRNNFIYYKNGDMFMLKDNIEWLCKNCFKQKYLELLENYKMELTEKYIEAGYIYDEFFNLN